MHNGVHLLENFWIYDEPFSSMNNLFYSYYYVILSDKFTYLAWPSLPFVLISNGNIALSILFKWWLRPQEVYEVTSFNPFQSMHSHTLFCFNTKRERIIFSTERCEAADENSSGLFKLKVFLLYGGWIKYLQLRLRVF